MSINVSEVIWTIVCFFALLFVLKKFLFDPLVRFMDARQAGIDEGLEKGAEAQRKKEENAAAMRESWKERSAEAKQLLAENALKIGAVAQQCGFSNSYHFCRLFKEKTALTPTEYRRQNRISKI